MTRAHRSGEYFPRFSETEFERRRSAVRKMMRKEDVNVLVAYGHSGINRRYQSNVYYLANYLDHHHNYLVFFADPGEESQLLVGLSSHVPTAAAWAEIDDTRAGGPDPAAKVVERIRETDAATGTVGVVGPRSSYGITIPHPHYETIAAGLDADIRDVSLAYEGVRVRKSEEEIEWLRRGAEFTDTAMEALTSATEPGVTEMEIKADLECAYLTEGGDQHISYISSTPMDNPERGKCLHWKQASERTVREGDVVNTELGAGYWGYTGQMQRTFSVGRPPTDEYRRLHDVAVETYENILDVLHPGNTTEDVLRAADPIIESEYTIYDGLVHGFGVDIVPPTLGTEDVEAAKRGKYSIENPMELRENMAVVVQPNPITSDERRGVQVGNLVVITQNGPEVLQDYPVDFVQL